MYMLWYVCRYIYRYIYADIYADTYADTYVYIYMQMYADMYDCRQNSRTLSELWSSQGSDVLHTLAFIEIQYKIATLSPLFFSFLTSLARALLSNSEGIALNFLSYMLHGTRNRNRNRNRNGPDSMDLTQHIADQWEHPQPIRSRSGTNHLPIDIIREMLICRYQVESDQIGEPVRANEEWRPGPLHPIRAQQTLNKCQSDVNQISLRCLLDVNLNYTPLIRWRTQLNSFDQIKGIES